MKYRKIEIHIEKRERITFFRATEEIRIICAVCECETLFIAPERAAVSHGLTMREIFRRVESGAIHFIETREGLTLICLNSLLAGEDEITALHDLKPNKY